MQRLIVKQFDKQLYDDYIFHLEGRGFEHIGSGAFRHVYRRRFDKGRAGNVVIKVPANRHGFEDNVTEAWAYHTYRKQADSNAYVYAPCRLLPNACLMMVYVAHPNYIYSLPDWCRYIDGYQCGWFKGRAVAFDSGADHTYQMRLAAYMWAGITNEETSRSS